VRVARREDQFAWLASLSEPFERDIRTSIEPTFTIEWRFDPSELLVVPML
jgi:hypothetical protein